MLIEATEPTEENPNPTSTFSMVAYNGGVMNVPNWPRPVIVDLQGMQVQHQKNPALYDHDVSKIVGHTTEVENTGTRVNIKGVVSGEVDEAKQVRAMGKREFPWQSSLGLGVRRNRIEQVPRGKVVHVNGADHVGPVDVARQSRFREVSFTPWGADSTTSATITASQLQEEEKMEVNNILAAIGDNLTDAQRTQLESTLLKASAGDVLSDAEKSLLAKLAPESDVAKDDNEEVPVAASANVNIEKELRAQAASVQRDIAAINAKFSDYPDLAAKAIEGEWDEERQDVELKAARLEKLQADRAGNEIDSFNVSVKGSSNELEVAEAAFALSAGCSPEDLMNPEDAAIDAQDKTFIKSSFKKYDEATVDLALSHYGTQFGPGQMVIWMARKFGKFSGFVDTNREKALKAGFTTIDLPTVFGNVLNRSLLAAYRNQTLTWNRIARAGSVRDFREVTRVRTFGTGYWESLGPSGDIKHGNLSEETYTNRAQTVAQINMLAREDFINDDLGALRRLTSDMARYGALAPEVGVYSHLLDADGGTFFSAANGNLLDDSPTTFDITGLGKLHTLFRKQTSGQPKKDSRRGKPKPYPSINPEILLVPVELEVAAWELTNSTWVKTDGGTKEPTANWARGRYTVISSPYLSDTGIHANANGTSYYLLANPNDVTAVEIVFLNGRQRPTIESVEPEAQNLGMGVRGWLDFGVALQDHRGAARADETA